MVQKPQPIRDNPSDFSYEFYQRVLKDGVPDILFHWHSELEISYIHSGKAKYTINDKTFVGQAGDIILVQPNSMHAITRIAPHHSVSETFSIDLDHLGRSIIDSYSQRYLQPLYNGHFELTAQLQKNMTGYEEIRQKLLGIFQLIKEKPLYFDILLKAKCHEFLYLIFKFRYVNRHYTSDTYQKYRKLRELIDYIHHHYAEELNIPHLADLFGYSRTHFMSIFKQHTGSSCMDFILKVRCSKACDLLTNTNYPIQDLASQTGFTNLSNFNRQFKKQYQMTPRQYRKEHTRNRL